MRISKKISSTLLHLANATRNRYESCVLRALIFLGLDFRPFFYPRSETLADLGRQGCAELFSIERSYHNLILAESDYRVRVKLYSEINLKIKECKARYSKRKQFGWSERLLASWLHLFKNKDVLDYGCGYGMSSAYIATVARTVCGIDSAQVCILHARAMANERELTNCTFLCCSDLTINLPSGSMDCAYSNDFLEHLHPRDALLHLKEIERVLSNNGCYLCYTPGFSSGPHDITKAFYPQESGFPPLGSHLKEYQHFELLDMGNKAGLLVEFPDPSANILALFKKRPNPLQLAL